MTDSPLSAPLSRQVRVPDAATGRRLDAVLAELFPEFSRSRLAAWIKSGEVLLDGAPARPRDVLHGGELVSLDARLGIETAARPEDIPLEVLYEDEALFVINKPAGLVVHPGAGNPDGTLVNALLHRDGALNQLPRAGIVHRLDKDTSGVMVVARTLPAHTRLTEMLAAREVHRQYLAVVAGAMVSGGTADFPIDRHPRDRLRMCVREDGREAITHYRLRERFRAHTALECRLETGRTHQIRVHARHIGHPVAGDDKYGEPEANRRLRQAAGLKRLFLHAARLEFALDEGRAPYRLEAPLPPELEEVMRRLGE